MRNYILYMRKCQFYAQYKLRIAYLAALMKYNCA